MHHKKPTKPKPKPKPNSKLVTKLMAPALFLALLFLLLFSLSSATHRHFIPPSHDSIPPEIHRACTATRFPDTCESSLKNVPPNPDPTMIILSAISVSYENLRKAESMVRTILDSSNANVNRSTAAKNCLEVLNNSEYRLNSTAEAVPRGRMKDARAWMSAALLFQYDCWSGLKYSNDTSLVNQTMSFLDMLTALTSNALSMIVSYDIYGNEVSSWTVPQTERGGFWESSTGSGSGYLGGFFEGLVVDVTVCGGQDCKFATVQEAVDAAPENLPVGKKYVIRIKEGVYEETVRVGLKKRNLVFLGDGMGKTVITGSLNVGQPGVSTYNTATVGVLGDGFMASGLTIKNTAGPDAHQAVALRSDSDLSVFENCEFIGNQDTLYAHSLRQFYKSCHISGNVDFIFGNSASVFEDCLILVRPRQIKPEKGENNAVTAHGRTDPAQNTGFVFEKCIVNGTDEYMALYFKNPKVHRNYLGRPWKEYSRTVFIQCNFEALITPQGWMPWSGDFALKTLYYGEFGNFGSGSNASGRVTWSSQIPAEHVGTYSVQNFIQGNEWIPTSS